MPTTRKPRAAKPTAEEELASPPVEHGEVLDPAAAAPEPQAAPPNGVLVLKITDEQGNISTDAQPVGNVLPTEVQTLLELGINGWRQKIGLEKAN